MSKRKLCRAVSEIMKKINCKSDDSFLNKTFVLKKEARLSDFLNSTRKGRRKRRRNRSSSSKESARPCKKQKVSFKRKHSKYQPKKRSGRERRMQKKKPLWKSLNSRSCNAKDSKSSEVIISVESDPRFKHLPVNFSADLEYLKPNRSNAVLKPSALCLSSSLQLNSESKHLRKLQGMSELEGIKFVKRNKVDGSATEITFQSKLLMHVKKRTDDVEKQFESCTSETKVIDISQLNDLFSEVNAGSRILSKCDSSNLLKLAVHNNYSQTKDGNSILRVRSSKNFMDLRMSQQNKFLNVNSNNSWPQVVKEIFPPQSFQESTANSIINSKSCFKNGQNQFIGDQNSIDSIISYDDYCKSASFNERKQSRSYNRCSDSFKSPTVKSCSAEKSEKLQNHSQNTVVTKAIVHSNSEI